MNVSRCDGAPTNDIHRSLERSLISNIGVQSAVHTPAEQDRGCQVSMDGRGAWRDNVFIERLWRTVKYEEIYLHAYDTVLAAKAGIARHLDWYNRARPHSSLKMLPGMLRSPRTPDEAYLMLSPACRLAA